MMRNRSIESAPGQRGILNGDRLNLWCGMGFALIGLWLPAGETGSALAQSIRLSGRAVPIPIVEASTVTNPLVELMPVIAMSRSDSVPHWKTIADSRDASRVPVFFAAEQFRRQGESSADPSIRFHTALQRAADWLPQPMPDRPLKVLPAESLWPSEPERSDDEPWASISDICCDAYNSCDRSLHLLPDGLLYKSYLAGEKEPRIAAVWLYEKGRGWIWETALGGRVGLLRYGTAGAVRPQGWQLDMEAAVFPRIDPIKSSEMDSIDFRVGLLSTWRFGPTAIKVGYYHISSHVGDEFLLRNPTFVRIEYVRDSAIFGIIHNLNDDAAVYAEIGYAIGHLGGAEPLEFQFGVQHSPAVANGLRGAPFAAVNGHLREDFDFGGNINVVAGWQWRGAESDRLLRAGFQYYNGKSLQYQFFDKNEELLGMGLWFDY